MIPSSTMRNNVPAYRHNAPLASATLSILLFTSLTLSVGCGDDAVFACASGDCTETTWVGRTLSFARENDNVTHGFDLDGRISDINDPVGCAWEDKTDPQGRVGIDNQFAVFWDFIVNQTGDAVEGLLRAAINDGLLLIAIQMRGIDASINDSCVQTDLHILTGKPNIGTDGLITTGQTFDIREDSPVMRVECGQLVNGELIASAFDGIIPVQLLGVLFDLKVFNVHIRATPDETTGEISIVFGAGIDVEQIIGVISTLDDLDELAELATPLLKNRADLMRDEFGDCQHLSATLLLQATPAFLFGDAGR